MLGVAEHGIIIIIDMLRIVNLCGLRMLILRVGDGLGLPTTLVLRVVRLPTHHPPRLFTEFDIIIHNARIHNALVHKPNNWFGIIWITLHGRVDPITRFLVIWVKNDFCFRRQNRPALSRIINLLALSMLILRVGDGLGLAVTLVLRVVRLPTHHPRLLNGFAQHGKNRETQHGCSMLWMKLKTYFPKQI